MIYDVPVFRLVGAADGPRVSLVSGLHGNEWYGVAALLKLRQLVDSTELRGTLTIVPAANVYALADRARESQRLPGDMNREFGSRLNGNANGLRQAASELWNAHLADSDVLVDIHCGGRYDMLFHAVIESGTSLETSPTRFLGVDYAVSCERYPEGSLVALARQSGCTPIGVELSCGWQLQQKRTDDLVFRLIQLLKGLQVLPGEPEYSQPPKLLQHGRRVRAKQFGLFTPHISIGAVVKRGEPVGEFQTFARAVPRQINAPDDGLVLSVLTAGPTDRGDSLVETSPL